MVVSVWQWLLERDNFSDAALSYPCDLVRRICFVDSSLCKEGTAIRAARAVCKPAESIRRVAFVSRGAAFAVCNAAGRVRRAFRAFCNAGKAICNWGRFPRKVAELFCNLACIRNNARRCFRNWVDKVNNSAGVCRNDGGVRRLGPLHDSFADQPVHIALGQLQNARSFRDIATGFDQSPFNEFHIELEVLRIVNTAVCLDSLLSVIFNAYVHNWWANEFPRSL